MKKFLTVLLVIAVMFTFSFGSTIAWAATTNYSVSDAEYYFGKAMDEVEDADTIDVHNYTVEYETLDHFRAELLDAAKEYAKAVDDNSYVMTEDNLSVLINSEGNKQETFDQIDNTDLAKDIVKYQYDADRTAAIAHLNEAWTNSASDFSTEKMDPECEVTGHNCTTYQDHVKKIVDDAIEDINEFASTTEKTFENFVTAKATIGNYIDAYNGETESVYTKLIKERGYETNAKKIGLGTYEINKNFTDDSGYEVNSSAAKLDAYTTENKKYDDATSDAKIAALKAKAAQVYANYIQTTKKDKYKDYADDVLTACNFLYEEKVATDTVRVEALLGTNGYDTAYDDWADRLDYAVKQVAELEEQVANLAAEKDSTGALVRDAGDVSDELKAGKIAIYKAAIDEGGVKISGLAATKAAIDKAVSDTVSAVTALYKSLDSEKLAYYKEYAKAKITDAYDDAKDYYYEPEYTAYKALVDEYTAKIDSAKDNKEVKKYVDELGKPANTSESDTASTYKIKSKIDNKYIIDQKTTNIVNTAKKYADDVNNTISGTSNDYYLGDSGKKLEEVIQDYVGASSARTQKEIDALSAQAIGLVSTLPTYSEVEKAEDAADDAIKALPKTITVDSKAAIDAAIAAVDAYEDLSADKNYTKKSDLTTAVTNYAYAINKNIKDRLDAVSKTDKEALKTLKAEVKAFEDTYEDYAAAVAVLTGNVKTDIQKDLDDIQETEKDAVKAAIRAIPVKANITEADKATVENARKLYDAYVAEYTEYDSAFNWDTTTDKDGFVADDFGTNYQDLVAAETMLGLNEDPAAPVEALKLKASSTAKKGSITVKWTVTGDASTIDGYEIWKSTKANKGYKKAFTTTKTSYKNTKDLKKGTRYYYKVRAYKMVDGVKVTSDWSNKAYRKAK